MLWPLLATGVALSLAQKAPGEGPEYPSLCVALAASARSSTAPLNESDVIAAIRARIARRQLRVRACRNDDPHPSTWKVTLERPTPETLQLLIDGQDLHVRHLLATAGVEPEQLTQLVALTTAEDVRPALDRLLLQLGVADEAIQEEAQALDALVAQVEESPAESVGAVVARPAAGRRLGPWGVQLSAGPMGGLDARSLQPYLDTALSLAWGPYDLELRLGGRFLEPIDHPSVAATGETYDAGVALRWRRGPLALGAGCSGRLTTLRLSPRSDQVRDGLMTFWDVGLGVDAHVTLVRFQLVELALIARSFLWWQPRRFLLGREILLTQSLGELYLGPALRFYVF